MCRITGFVDLNFKGDYDMEKTIVRMRDTMSAGGPDDAGVFTEKEKGIALGHRRLSIIDLSSSGHQPMHFENLVITYNGEVYNFTEIRKELEKENYRFTSSSDTEVILKAFHKWGMNAVQKFKGMWSFAIWNKTEEKLILCRDRIGVKPMYWYLKDDLFLFSSELKAFHQHSKFNKEISETGLGLFLQYGYIASPYSIFKHAYKLEPGHFLILNKKGEIKKEKYWDVEESFSHGSEEKNEWDKKSETDIEKELEAILTESFKLRMVSDVPVGVFLSGGIDSSTVTALLQKESSSPLKTFTIGFDGEYNEAPFAKKIAKHLGTDHTELHCTQEEARTAFHVLPGIFDEPFGDSSAIPTLLVSKLARQKVKVSLSADGGDEQFYGYARYWHVIEKAKDIANDARRFSRTLNLLQPQTLFDEFGNLKFSFANNQKLWNKYTRWWTKKKGQEMYSWYDIYVKIFQEQDVEDLGIHRSLSQLFNFDYSGHLSPSEIMMLYDLKNYLPEDLLAKVDRTSMSVGLEGRDPFLDQKIIEYSSRLPLHYKFRNGEGKYMLRKIVYNYVPKELLDRPKQGFTIPIHKWFKNEFRDLLNQHLSFEKIKKEGILHAEEVKQILDDYLSGKEENFNKIYLLLVFQLWKEKWG